MRQKKLDKFDAFAAAVKRIADPGVWTMMASHTALARRDATEARRLHDEAARSAHFLADALRLHPLDVCAAMFEPTLDEKKLPAEVVKAIETLVTNIRLAGQRQEAYEADLFNLGRMVEKLMPFPPSAKK